MTAENLDRLLSCWWLPEAPEQTFVGHLTREPGGVVSLELAGRLGGDGAQFGALSPQVLHGMGHQGPLFTARRLIQTGSGMGMPGFPTETYRPLSLIIGAHVDESTLYDQMLLEANFLSDWLQMSGIQITITGGGPDARGAVGVGYEWPTVLTSEVAPGVVVRTWSAHHGSTQRAGYAITENVAMKVQCEDPIPVETLIDDYAMPLIDLLSFGTRASNAIDRLTLRSPTMTMTVQEEVQPIDLEYVTEWVVPPQADGEERRHSHQMNFTLADAPIGFEALIQRWFALRRQQRLALAPYFGMVYAPPTYMDVRLVLMSHALEAYHRTSGLPRAAMSKADFATFKSSLLAGCPPERVDFLRNKLGYLNEISQVDRTTQLVERASASLDALLSRRPTFVHDFVSARNTKTHPDGSKTEFTGLQLYDLAETAKYVFEANIMLDLGFEAAQCAELFTRQPSFRNLAEHPPSE